MRRLITFLRRSRNEIIKLLLMIFAFCQKAKKKKKLWNMRVTVIPIVINTLGIVPMTLEELEIGRRTKIQH